MTLINLEADEAVHGRLGREVCVEDAQWLSTQAAFAIALPCGVSSLCICSAVADGRLGIAIRCRFASPFTSIKTSITPRRR